MQNSVLRETFWHKMYEVKGDCRKMHNIKIYILHSLGDQIKENEVSWKSIMPGKEGKLYSIMRGKPEAMRRLGRRGHRKEDNIKKILKK